MTSSRLNATSDLVPVSPPGCAAPYRFLAPKGPEAAKRGVQAIRQGVKVLEQQPGVGRPVEDMDDEFRDWIIDFGDSGYVARYRVDQQFITILAVRHQKEVGF
jgi:plasmid stabilization system protein ParE